MAVGDVFTNLRTTSLAYGTGGVVTDLSFPAAPSQTSADISKISNTEFDFVNAGRYLVIDSQSYDYSLISNNNRKVFVGRVEINGGALANNEGRHSSYGRDASNADEGHSVGVTYLDVSANDRLVNRVQNIGDATAGDVNSIANQGALQIVRMPDNSDYIKKSTTTPSCAVVTVAPGTGDEPTTGYTQVNMNAQQAISGSSLASSTNGITLGSAGTFLLLYSGQVTTGGGRKGAVSRLLLDGIEIEGSRSFTYLRGIDGADEGVIGANTIVEWDGVGSGEILLECCGVESDTSGSVTWNGGTVTVVRLPDTVSYAKAVLASNLNFPNGNILTVVSYTELSDDQGLLTGNDFGVDGGRYAFLFSQFCRRNINGGTRLTPHMRFRLGGSVQAFGSALSYLRGDQANDDVNVSGKSGAFIQNTATGSLVSFEFRQESGNPNSQAFASPRTTVSLIDLDTLAGVAPVQNLRIGGALVDNLRLGSSDVDRVYLGGDLVWER